RREIGVNYEANFPAIYAHSKRVGCDNDAVLGAHEALLDFFARLQRQASVICHRIDAQSLQLKMDVIHILSSSGINNAQLVVASYGGNRPDLFCSGRGFDNFEIKVRTVEPADNLGSVINSQLTGNILPHGGSGRCSESENAVGFHLVSKVFQ